MKLDRKPTYEDLMKKVADLEEERIRYKEHYHEMQRLRFAIECAPVAIGMSDPEGHHYYQNRAFTDLFEYKTARELEKAGGGLALCTDPDVAEEKFGNIRTGRSWSGEQRMVTKSGRVLHAFEQADAIKDNENNIIGLIGLITDISEEKKAEWALIESEKKYRNTLETIQMAAVSLDLKGCITFANDHLLRLSGWRLDDILGKSWFDCFVPPEHRTEIERDVFLKSIHRGAAPEHYENAIITRTGEIRDISWNNTILKDEQGKVFGMTSLGQDVTDSKRMENELRFYKRRLEDKIAERTLELKTVNNELKKAHDELELKVDARTAELKESNLQLTEEIQTRRRIETKLKRQNAYLSALHDISIGMFGRMDLSALLETIVKRAAKLTDIPDGFLHLYDPDTDELEIKAGCGNFTTLVGHRVQSGKGLAGRVWATGKPLIVEDYKTWQGRNSSPVFDFCHAMIGIPLESDSGTVGVIGLSFPDEKKTIAKSLTPVLEQFAELASLAIYNAGLFEKIEAGLKKQLEVEKEKREMEKQLFQAQKMESIGNLAGGIAHDFNNILSAIIGFTELSLDDVEKGSNLEDNLQGVYTAGKRARDLVRQILTFARQTDEEVKPIQVDTIAREVIQFIRSSIPTTIQIRKNLMSNSLILGNTTQVHQILMNLCTNAAHAMEEYGGILDISLKDALIEHDVDSGHMTLKNGDYVVIKVSDTGQGIAPDIIGSIFEPYFTTKDLGEGTGMGLAVVHGIIDSYGGHIRVDSTPGKGSIFTIHLPIIKKRREDGPYQSEKLPEGTERILLVDDEVPIIKLGRQILERLGYDVTTRTNSVEALELFRSKPKYFHLVITDMTMPHITGDKLATEIMAIRSDVPIILCTGYSKKISDDKISEIGIKALIHKPLVRTQLSKTIREVLDEAKSGTHTD